MNIPRFRPYLPDDCKEAINSVIESGELANGQHINLFEKRFSNVFNYEQSIAISNGFSALHLTLEAHIGKSSKKVLIPACSTCFAVANAVKASGNKPVLYDLDCNSLDINYESIQYNIFYDTEALITIPHFGIPINNKKIQQDFNLFIIEDASQAIFLKFSNINQYAYVSTFSLYPTKGLVGIDGGLVACQDSELANQIRNLRYYNHQMSISEPLCYNYKLNNVNAAFALCYLDNMNEIIDRRREIQQKYNEVIKDFVELMRWHPDNRTPVLQKYILVFQNISQTNRFIECMHHQDIDVCRELFLLDDKPQLYPNATFLQNNLISVPSYEALHNQEVEYISKCMRTALEEVAHVK